MNLPAHVDVDAVARHELRWEVVRREIGLAAGKAAGESITDLYASLYDVPREAVAEAGRLRGEAAEIRDRGATDDPDGPRGAGAAYWPAVARLLRDSYRSLKTALDSTPSVANLNGLDASKTGGHSGHLPAEAASSLRRATLATGDISAAEHANERT